MPRVSANIISSIPTHGILMNCPMQCHQTQKPSAPSKRSPAKNIGTHKQKEVSQKQQEITGERISRHCRLNDTTEEPKSE
mmetsp:Transcript_7209/g.12601  ORF Transcript_7209/g.12601 Transcript_7209/m.12601 type:complete len:80 (+) Transcript_7209:290-529(+)